MTRENNCEINICLFILFCGPLVEFRVPCNHTCFVDQIIGDMNLILSVPHDGKTDTKNWSDSSGCDNRIVKSSCYGKRFNDEITQSLVSRMNIFKHHYSCKSSAYCELVYGDYHRPIVEAVQMMHGSVLILDIHSTSLPNDDDIVVIYGGKSDANVSSCGIDSLIKRQNMSIVKAICGNYSSWGFLRRERLKVSPGFESCLKLELVDNEKGVTVNVHCVFSNCSNCVDFVKMQFSNKFNSNQTKSLIEALMKFITYHDYTKDILCKSFGTIQSTTVKYHHVSSLKSRNELRSKYQIRTTEVDINIYISEIVIFRATSGHLELRPKQPFLKVLL